MAPVKVDVAGLLFQLLQQFHGRGDDDVTFVDERRRLHESEWRADDETESLSESFTFARDLKPNNCIQPVTDRSRHQHNT